MAIDQGGKAWKTRRFRVRYLYHFKDGLGEFVHEQDFVISKRRWADSTHDDNAYHTRYDIPGTNLTLFIPGPMIEGVLEFTREYGEKLRRELKELNALLDVPIEEADGTTVIEPPAKNKGV